MDLLPGTPERPPRWRHNYEDWVPARFYETLVSALDQIAREGGTPLDRQTARIALGRSPNEETKL